MNRLQEARFLLENNYTTAAVYLAGYAVECALKALILSTEPAAKNRATLESFRGARAHDFEWLKKELGRRSVNVPAKVNRQLDTLAWWTTDLRYNPSTLDRGTAEEFLATVSTALVWAEGRL